MRSKTSAALLLVLSFVMGSIAGAVAFNLYRNHVAAAGPHDIVAELAQDLKLDEAQKDKLRLIMNQTRERFRALSKQMEPQFQAIRDESNREIRQILRDDQKANFEKVIQALDQRRRPRGNRGPK